MPVGFDSIRAGASGGADAYEIDYACRFNNDDSAYLTRTPSAGNLTTWTVSVWLKLAGLNLYQTLFCGASNSSNQGGLQFRPGDFLYMWHEDGGSEAQRIQTASLYRDPSAWMHVVAQWDTTDGTAADRHTLWINGVRLTDFTSSTNPGSSKASDWNAGIAQYIGRDGSSSYMDSYLADFVFIDGQALAPTSFGETNADTGQWVPIDPSGLTFGTNGFYLDFANASDLGNDVSGNNNDWTSSGLATNDQMTDTPTNNHCVINPLDVSGMTLSDGNLDVDQGSSSWDGRTGTIAVDITDSDGFYFEYLVDAVSGGFRQAIGICNNNLSVADMNADPLQNSVDIWAYGQNGKKGNNSELSYGDSWVATDVIGVLLKAGALTFYVDGVSQGDAFTGLTGYFRPYVCLYASGSDGTLRFQEASWTESKPAGVKAINTANLAAPTIEDPSAYFQTTLYTGNATGSRAITQDGNSQFGPDMVWIKNRDQNDSWMALDTTRGATKELNIDSLAVESTDSNGLTAFSGSDGFTLGTGANGYNDNSEDFAACQWEKGVTPGFDIVAYSGNGSSPRNISHGLGVVPDIVILKARTDDVGVFYTYHSTNTSAPETEFLRLDETNETADDATIWNDTAPTSSVFTVGSSGDVNESGDTYIVWLFTAVEGFSAFGSYIGNGSTDGPMINLGFKPAMIMFKASSHAYYWAMKDNQRSPTNPSAVSHIWGTGPETEGSGAAHYNDLLSNGFKLRGTGTSFNTSGVTYLYMAWAESPFKTATAR